MTVHLDRIKRHCLVHGMANLLHAESSDFINAGSAFFSCDGLSFTPDMLAALMGMTAKQRQSTMMQEFKPEDIGCTDDEFSTVADGNDKPVARLETVHTELGVIRVYAAPDGTNLYCDDAPLTVVERAKKTEICARKTANNGWMIVACEGYIVAMLAHADKDSGAYARAVKRRAEKLSAITKDVKGEE